MKNSITIDLITEDSKSCEFVLYLVEDGPWPETETHWNECLSRIQNRILDAFDAAVDGHLANEYPESKGTQVRIQIDSPNGIPSRLVALIEKIQNFIKTDRQYSDALEQSKFIAGLRVVTGQQMGRFQNS